MNIDKGVFTILYSISCVNCLKKDCASHYFYVHEKLSYNVLKIIYILR